MIRLDPSLPDPPPSPHEPAPRLDAPPRAGTLWPRVVAVVVTDLVIGVVLVAMLGRNAVLPVALFALATALTIYSLLRRPTPPQPQRARRMRRTQRHRHTWTPWSHDDHPGFNPTPRSEDEDLGLGVTRARHCRECRLMQTRDHPLVP